MKDRVMEFCKRVIKNNGVLSESDCACIWCDVDNCPFTSKNNNGKVCGADTVENYIKIAEKYIKDHKEGNKMEKTLLEIITDGFNNKVYENKEGDTVYFASNGELIFNYKNLLHYPIKVSTEVLDLNHKYKLQRKKYTFTEAFKAYEEGKEIKSLYSKFRYKKLDGKDYYFNIHSNSFVQIDDDIDFKEIRGEWYINEENN